VLVAEDNAINQKVISAMLRGLGCHADIAPNGRDALERWERGSYDLILMDCQMPLMSGFEAAEAIRQRERASGARIPILAMTAQAYAQDRVRCLQAGMDGHLAKPLTASELESALSQWLPLDGGAGVASLPSPASGAASACIDVERLERLESELGEGGRELLRDLIETFFADFQLSLERLAQNAAAAAWERVASEAHRLRSSTANLATTELSRLCTRLEECARGTAPGRADELIQRMRDEFPRVRTALAAHAHRPPSSLPEAREATTAPAASETNSVSS
jgi:CheY-like chemotaxis protein